MNFAYTAEEFRGYRVGDVFKYHGRYVRMTKKTSTAVAVENYTIADRLFDWLVALLDRVL